MKTESKTTILRNLRSQWTHDFGNHKLDLINSEILKLSIKTGPISDSDITSSLKKLSFIRGNQSLPKPRGATEASGTSSVKVQYEDKLLINGKQKSLRTSGVDQIRRMQDDIAVAKETRNHTHVTSIKGSLEK